jgi:hypothetical protein
MKPSCHNRPYCERFADCNAGSTSRVRAGSSRSYAQGSSPPSPSRSSCSPRSLSPSTSSSNPRALFRLRGWPLNLKSNSVMSSGMLLAPARRP